MGKGMYEGKKEVRDKQLILLLGENTHEQSPPSVASPVIIAASFSFLSFAIKTQ
jgi:hypothetical protein